MDIEHDDQVQKAAPDPKLKQYEVWLGSHQFYCRGRFMSGPNVRNLILTALAINLTNVISLAFTWTDYISDKSNPFPLLFGLAMWAIVDYLLYKAAFTDPGLIPRSRIDSWLVLDGMRGQKTHLLKMKFCFTCLIIRPNRSVHCSACDVCVEQMDHHCPYISNCVGRRNYRFFFGFITSLWVDSLFLLWLTLRDIMRRSQSLQDGEEQLTFQSRLVQKGDAIRTALREVPLAIPVVFLVSVTLLGLTALVAFHIKLNLYNQTTGQVIKGTTKSMKWSPYETASTWENFKLGVFPPHPKRALLQPRQLVINTLIYSTPTQTTAPCKFQPISEQDNPPEIVDPSEVDFEFDVSDNLGPSRQQDVNKEENAFTYQQKALSPDDVHSGAGSMTDGPVQTDRDQLLEAKVSTRDADTSNSKKLTNMNAKNFCPNQEINYRGDLIMKTPSKKSKSGTCSLKSKVEDADTSECNVDISATSLGIKQRDNVRRTKLRSLNSSVLGKSASVEQDPIQELDASKKFTQSLKVQKRADTLFN